jgi:hypothetical protein
MSHPARGPKLGLGIDGKASATQRRRALFAKWHDVTEALT